MSRTVLSALGHVCFCLVLAAVATFLSLAFVVESLACNRGGSPLPRRDENRRRLPVVAAAVEENGSSVCRRQQPDMLSDSVVSSAESVRLDSDDSFGDASLATPGVLPTHATILIHGVNDDGKGWSLRFKNALEASHPADSAGRVYLFRWTQPDGEVPGLDHARNSLKGVEARFPDQPESEAGYQVAVAERLRDFLAGARSLYRDYGVEGRIDVVAHSQGTLITLAALDRGAEADDVVFLGSPLLYIGDRQDDVAGAVPHVRGVLYNYYAKSDAAIRYMGGGLLFEPRGWPEKDLPAGKVIQACLNVKGHSGYYTEEAIRANYLDKVGLPSAAQPRLPATEVKEFTDRWDGLVKQSGLIAPE